MACIIVVGLGIWSFRSCASDTDSPEEPPTAGAGQIQRQRKVLIDRLIAEGVFAKIETIMPSLSIASRKPSDKMQRLLEQENELRRVDFSTLARLRRLSRQPRLTADEMGDALVLIHSLRKRYGPIGIELDTTADKVTGVLAAEVRIQELMAEAALAELQRASDEMAETAEILRWQLARRLGFDRPVSTVWVYTGKAWHALSAGEKQDFVAMVYSFAYSGVGVTGTELIPVLDGRTGEHIGQMARDRQLTLLSGR